MAARDSDFELNAAGLTRALETLSMRLRMNTSDPLEIVVCGGSALILTGGVPRTTVDSETFRSILAGLLRSIGHDGAADRI